MRKAVATLSLFGALAGTPCHAGADPVSLNSLSIFTLDVGEHSYRFAGDSFEFRLGLVGFSVPFLPFEGKSCFPIPPACRVGDVIGGTLRTEGEVGLGSGPGVINNVTFSTLTFHGSLAFTTEPFTLQAPPDSGDDHFFEVTQPFKFNGLFRAFNGDASVFANQIQGSGKFVQPFLRNEDGILSPEEAPAHFLFESPAAATPEPPTMLLVGAGALALTRRKSVASLIRSTLSP
jgi:hypothetical protein